MIIQGQNKGQKTKNQKKFGVINYNKLNLIPYFTVNKRNVVYS